MRRPTFNLPSLVLLLCLPLLSQCNTREVYEWVQSFSHPKHMGATQQILVACNTTAAPAVPTGLVTSTGIKNVINTQWDDQAGCTFNVYVDGALNQEGVVWQATFHKVNIGAPNTEALISISAVSISSGLESPQCTPVAGTSGS